MIGWSINAPGDCGWCLAIPWRFISLANDLLPTPRKGYYLMRLLWQSCFNSQSPSCARRFQKVHPMLTRSEIHPTTSSSRPTPCFGLYDHLPVRHTLKSNFAVFDSTTPSRKKNPQYHSILPSERDILRSFIPAQRNSAPPAYVTTPCLCTHPTITPLSSFRCLCTVQPLQFRQPHPVPLSHPTFSSSIATGQATSFRCVLTVPQPPSHSSI